MEFRSHVIILYSKFLQISIVFFPEPTHMKILIIEDEKELSNSIATYLEKENYICEIAKTSIAALKYRVIRLVIVSFYITISRRQWPGNIKEIKS